MVGAHHPQVETESESTTPRFGLGSPLAGAGPQLERAPFGEARHSQAPPWLSDWRLKLGLSSQV